MDFFGDNLKNNVQKGVFVMREPCWDSSKSFGRMLRKIIDIYLM